jgi:hypothetical protein
LDSYLRSTGESCDELLKHWSRAETWSAFVPSGSLPAEKSLFAGDMRGAIKILSLRLDDGAPDHIA